MASMVDSWVVVDKTDSGELRAKASLESLYISDDEFAKPRVHVQNTTSKNLAPELMDWINNAVCDLPVAERNPSTTSSYKTNSSSASRRTARRSSIHGTGDFGGLVRNDDCYNDGMFVVKVLEVRQIGANKAMNLQCVAQVGDEKFAIAPVQTQAQGNNVWVAKMDDTFVFDVSRQFSFNLGVLGTHVPSVRRQTTMSRIGRLHLGSQVSVATTQTSRSKKRISGLFSKMFRNKQIARDPAYAGCQSRVSLQGPAFVQDDVLRESTTDGQGRSVEIQRHSVYVEATSPRSSTAEFSQNTGFVARNRANTTATEHSVFRPRLRTFSTASQASVPAPPQSLGELFLDFRVDRREKRRTTLTLPAVNRAQETMRGGPHVEVQVLLEYGILVNETYEERCMRLERERERDAMATVQRRRAEAERQWMQADKDDKLPRVRGFVSVFTRSGRISTWKRYWAVLSTARVLLFDSQDENVPPAASISLFHLHGAGVPETDLVNIGPTGIELRLSPLAMTDRHRRQSAHPRTSDAHDIDVNELTGDDATLVRFCDWQCRVYLLLASLRDRDLWLHELTNVTVPGAEFARFRARQRRQWRAEEFSVAAEQLRLAGKPVQVVAGQAMPGMSEEATLTAKQVFLESIGRSTARVVSMSGICGEFGGNTLTNAKFAPRLVSVQPAMRVPSGQHRLPLPASLCAEVFPPLATVASPPPMKKMRARRSSSNTELSQSLGLPGTAVPKDRNVSGGSTVIQVMGTAKERRQGTVSRRFLFVWSVNDL